MSDDDLDLNTLNDDELVEQHDKDRLRAWIGISDSELSKVFADEEVDEGTREA